MAERDRWNEHYRAGIPPWDSGKPDPHLQAFVAERALRGRVLDAGCGTGTNAVWLAQQGFEVVGVDLAPLAIERARARAAAAGVSVPFEVVDMLTDPLPGPFDLVYDRGVWHVFDAHADRSRFAEVVAALLVPGGRWLSISGSTEGAPREMGPPRRSVRDLALAIEPHLAIEEIRAGTFGVTAEPPDPAPSWRAVMVKRTIPAQPSTGSG